MNRLAADIRFTFRQLRKNPGFAVVALLCLILGVGVNAAVFGVVYGILMKPLPYPEPERLVRLYETYQEGDTYRLSPARLDAYRDEGGALADVAAVRPGWVSLTDEEGAERLRVADVSFGLFTLLGVGPEVGRGFEVADDAPGSPAAKVVLGHDFWLRRFGGRRDVLGQSLRLDGTPHVVVGVMPRGIAFPEDEADPVDLWRPLGLDTAAAGRDLHTLHAVARLAPGVTPDAARSSLERIAVGLARETPALHEGWGVRLVPLREVLVGDGRATLLILLSLAAVVFLIACFNLASLQMVRVMARRDELAVRSALGAERNRLLRQLVTEGLVLGLLGGVLGLLASRLAQPILDALNPLDSAAALPGELELPVLGFALGLSLVAGLAVGLLPALRLRRLVDAADLAHGGGRGGVSRRWRRWQKTVVVAEVALAFVLLIGASLTLRSFLHLNAVDPGFEPDRLLTAGMSLPRHRYSDPPTWIAFERRMLEEVRALPEVEAAGLSLVLPFSEVGIRAAFAVEGQAARDEVLVTHHRLVSPGYLEALRVPLLDGRLLEDADREDAPPVVVVSRELARRHWGGHNAVGRRVRRLAGGSDTPWLTVVGVVDDIRDGGLGTEPEPAWYLPFTQHPTPSYRLVARTRTPPEEVAGRLCEVMRRLDPEIALYDVTSLRELLSGSLDAPRFTALLLGVFAILGLLLALSGIYGVLAYLVRERRRDFGIRLALGARRGRVLRSVLWEGLTLALAGVAVGALGAWILGTSLSSLLTGIDAHDPAVLVSTALLLATAALAASLIPSLRATRVEAATVLRE